MFKPNDKNFLLLLYKLFYDALALMLAAFALLIVLNGMLPEFFLHSSLLVKLALLIMLLVSGIVVLGKKLNIAFPFTAKTMHSPLVPAALIFIFLLTGNALLKLKLWENMLLTVLLVFPVYQLYKLLLTDTDKK